MHAADAFAARTAELASTQNLPIVKCQLLGGWRVEQLRPPKEVGPRDIERADRKLGVSSGDPVPKLIEGNVEEAKDDAGTNCASFVPAGVPLCP